MSALGSRLVELCIGIPYFDPSEQLLGTPFLARCFFNETNPLSSGATNVSPTAGLGIDLSHCSELEWLYIGANPAFLTYDGSPDLVNTILRSWKPADTVANPVVIFFTNDAQAFTRHAFVEVLQALGRIAEDWFRDVSEAEDAPDLRQNVKVRVYDWEEWRGWWWGHIQACFPTWFRMRRLDMEFLTRECLQTNLNLSIREGLIPWLARNEDDIWKGDEEALHGSAPQSHDVVG